MPVGKPITPAEVVMHKTGAIAPEVFDAINDLIARKWDGNEARVGQAEVVLAIQNRLRIERHEIFQRGYLDVEESYRAAGWHVEYDKPAYCETYEPFFTFKRPGKRPC